MRHLPDSLTRRLQQDGRGLTILVLRLGALGDILRTLPPVRLVRASLPHCRLIWVVDEAWRAMLDGHPDLDGVVTLPRGRWQRLLRSPSGWPRIALEIHRLGRRLRRLEAGLALDFHGNARTGVAGWLSRARVRLGYSGHQQKEGNRLLTTHRIPAGPRRLSRIERNLALVRALGLPTGPLPDGGLVIPAPARARARAIVEESGASTAGYGVLSPGASRRQAYKRPPPPLLAAAARAFRASELTPIVVYGPGEESDARRAVDEAGGAARLAPPTDLWTLAALLRGARALVAGDTGPLHLACAVGCPVVAIYGPTDPVVNAPWGVPHRIVRPAGVRYTGIKRKDRDAGRFDGVFPFDVEKAVSELLA